MNGTTFEAWSHEPKQQFHYISHIFHALFESIYYAKPWLTLNCHRIHGQQQCNELETFFGGEVTAHFSSQMDEEEFSFIYVLKDSLVT